MSEKQSSVGLPVPLHTAVYHQQYQQLQQQQQYQQLQQQHHHRSLYQQPPPSASYGHHASQPAYGMSPSHPMYYSYPPVYPASHHPSHTHPAHRQSGSEAAHPLYYPTPLPPNYNSAAPPPPIAYMRLYCKKCQRRMARKVRKMQSLGIVVPPPPPATNIHDWIDVYYAHYNKLKKDIGHVAPHSSSASGGVCASISSYEKASEVAATAVTETTSDSDYVSHITHASSDCPTPASSRFERPMTPHHHSSSPLSLLPSSAKN
ncbi:hypothetical protein DIPPA_05074 [Diplonema papillatum]|nr:hypothetical protein DIPPA_05074 [Diplonema papillatum]